MCIINPFYFFFLLLLLQELHGRVNSMNNYGVSIDQVPGLTRGLTNQVTNPLPFPFLSRLPSLRFVPLLPLVLNATKILLQSFVISHSKLLSIP